MNDTALEVLARLRVRAEDGGTEASETRARVVDLEEAVRSLQRQVVILREACYVLSDGGQPTLAGVGERG